MERFNPTRLELARRRRGFTKVRLASGVGVTPRTITDYASVREPPEITVRELARTLEFPVEFFYGPDLESPLAEGVSFRALSTLTASQRDQALGAATIGIQISKWAEEQFQLPAPAVPRLTGEHPEAAAEAIRSAWGLGHRKVGNLVHVLEAHGVRVFSLARECADVDAFSFWHHRTPFVFLNTRKTAERSRMDAAHELGHLVLHAHGGKSGRPAEDEAQAFGAAFLMSRRSVLADAPRGATAKQIIQAKRGWNVSAMNLAYRMRKLDLLTEWQARSIYIQLGRMGYRDSEPGGIPRETSQVWGKIFSALRAAGVSRADAARQLAIGMGELDRAMFGLVLIGHDGQPKVAESAAGKRPALHVV